MVYSELMSKKLSKKEYNEPVTKGYLYEMFSNFWEMNNEKFDTIDKRFESLETKMESKFATVDRRFESLEFKLDKSTEESKERFEKHEKHHDEIWEKLYRHDKEISFLKNKTA